MPGVKMLYGPMATLDSVGVKQFEQQPISIQAARDLGQKIAEALGK